MMRYYYVQYYYLSIQYSITVLLLWSGSNSIQRYHSTDAFLHTIGNQRCKIRIRSSGRHTPHYHNLYKSSTILRSTDSHHDDTIHRPPLRYSKMQSQSPTQTQSQSQSQTKHQTQIQPRRTNTSHQSSYLLSSPSTSSTASSLNPNNNTTTTTSTAQNPPQTTRRNLLTTLTKTTALLTLPSLLLTNPPPANAGRPEIDSRSGELFTPRDKMIGGGGSDAARGIPLRSSTEPVVAVKKLGAGPIQNVYETRFIGYLSRFLLNYDPAAGKWWDGQVKEMEMEWRVSGGVI